MDGCDDTRLLTVRVFDEATRNAAYAKQTSEARAEGKSNCPLCAVSPEANRSKIWNLR
ncbi:MAG TPA: hypothetical protein PLR56_01525 [Brevefilum sp.]|nr:hypothetical protein [Brevefilum sp.]HPL68852.1 hypothetical protein [Brevefilum sp.]